MTRHLRDLPGRLRPFLTAFCVMGAALFFALVAFANRDDAGVVFITGFLAGCFTVSALVLATSGINEGTART